MCRSQPVASVGGAGWFSVRFRGYGRSGGVSAIVTLADVNTVPELLSKAGPKFVPIISAFFGIVIRMYYKEHEPQHFHAEHAGQPAKFDFDGNLVAGAIRSRRARARIEAWAVSHRAELEANWTSMKAGKPLESIEPLREDKR